MHRHRILLPLALLAALLVAGCAATRQSREDVKGSGFLRDYSIEVTPHDAEKLDAIRAELAPGTAVYVAHPPGVPIDR